jgi:hypothetical protein
LAFFRAGEEIEQACAVQEQDLAGVEQLCTFTAANRRHRFRTIVMMILLPMSVLAVIAVLKLWA